MKFIIEELRLTKQNRIFMLLNCPDTTKHEFDKQKFDHNVMFNDFSTLTLHQWIKFNIHVSKSNINLHMRPEVRLQAHFIVYGASWLKEDVCNLYNFVICEMTDGRIKNELNDFLINYFERLGITNQIATVISFNMMNKKITCLHRYLLFLIYLKLIELPHNFFFKYLNKKNIIFGEFINDLKNIFNIQLSSNLGQPLLNDKNLSFTKSVREFKEILPFWYDNKKSLIISIDMWFQKCAKKFFSSNLSLDFTKIFRHKEGSFEPSNFYKYAHVNFRTESPIISFNSLIHSASNTLLEDFPKYFEGKTVEYQCSLDFLPDPKFCSQKYIKHWTPMMSLLVWHFSDYKLRMFQRNGLKSLSKFCTNGVELSLHELDTVSILNSYFVNHKLNQLLNHFFKNTDKGVYAVYKDIGLFHFLKIIELALSLNVTLLLMFTDESLFRAKFLNLDDFLHKDKDKVKVMYDIFKIKENKPVQGPIYKNYLTIDTLKGFQCILKSCKGYNNFSFLKTKEEWEDFYKIVRYKFDFLLNNRVYNLIMKVKINTKFYQDLMSPKNEKHRYNELGTELIYCVRRFEFLEGNELIPRIMKEVLPLYYQFLNMKKICYDVN